jgi:hypothetical protein
MVKLILLLLALSAFDTSLFAKKTQAEKVKMQNLEVVRMAAKEMTSKLPQKVDTYTQLVAIEPKDESLTYIFEINTGAKSDAAIIREAGKRKMDERIMRGICSSSKRFIENGIAISYLYKSAASKKQLFRYDANETRCRDLIGPAY